MKAAFSDCTAKNLNVQLKSYFSFCKFYGLTVIPTTVETLCLYGQFLGRSFKSVDSIRNYISGIKTLHHILEVEFPSEHSHPLKLMFKGLARCKPHLPHRALPITPQILLDMHQFLDVLAPAGATFWCVFLFMFFLIARKSDMVPNLGADIDLHKQLLRQDIQVFSNLLVVFIKWSKNNPFGNRLLKITFAAIPGSVLCPVTAYYNMVRLNPASETGSAFIVDARKAGASRQAPLSYRQLQEKIKILIHKTCRDPLAYSSHSFRRGGCTWAFKAGVPVNLIQQHGDWLSKCYQNYLSFDFSQKLSVSKHMSLQILEKLE